MNTKTYVKEVAKLIAQQQEVQMNNPPSSPQWKSASREIHRLKSLRLLGLPLTALLMFFASGAQAQISMSPLVTEVQANKKGLARGEFTVSNGSISPVATVIEVQRLGHDENGKVTLTPTSRELRLSETSARIGPRSSHVFAWETSCVDCAFVIFAGSSDARRVNDGIRMQLRLGHTIYVSKKGESLRRKFTTETRP
jgi:hypothetical protein